MDSIETICETLGDTYAGASLRELAALYDQVERESELFCKEYEIACGPGCGTCCEHFMPDITLLEARMVAAYLLLIHKERSVHQAILESVERKEGPCPLYRPDSPYHCSVYPVRPLICRLFGACANGDKEGNGVFVRCRYNKEKTMPSLLYFGPEVPVMQDYSYTLRSLDTSKAEVELLPKALLGQLEQLSFLVSMIERDGGYPNPDDTPTPQAV